MVRGCTLRPRHSTRSRSSSIKRREWRIELRLEENEIGRDTAAIVGLDAPAVSRHHTRHYSMALASGSKTVEART
jgi:hypothetical protein